MSFVLALLCASCWWLLKAGIIVEHLPVPGADIRQLSLRLDQGLIIHVRQLNITALNSADKAAVLEKQLSRFKRWGHLIQEIDIGSLSYLGHTAAITYRDGLFRARTDHISIDAALAYSDGMLWLNLMGLRITPYQLSLTGHASYSIAEDSLLFAGQFSHPLGVGSLWLRQQADRVEAVINTEEFAELAPVLAQFPLDPEITTWVADNISAGSYRIKQLRLHFNLQKLQNFGPDTISGTAVADAVTIRFHPELEPVHCDRVYISLQDDRLTFALDNPMYKKKQLQGSSVYIDHVIQEGSTLGINIMAETVKDKNVDEILEKYGISLPAGQVAGTTRAALHLLFDLSDFTLAATGVISTGAGEWIWRDMPLRTAGASVQLVNNHVSITRAALVVGDKFAARMSGFFDTRTLHAALQFELDSLVLGTANTSVLQATGLQIPLTMDFRNGVTLINMPELRTTLRLGTERADIDIDSLRAVAPFVPLLQKLSFTDGKMHLSMQDLSQVQFSGEIDIPNTILSLQDRPVTRFQFLGARTPDRTDIMMNNSNITVSWTDRVAVNLNGYLVAIDTNAITRGQEFSTPFPLKITGSRSRLQVKEQLVSTGMFEFNAKDFDISFRAELEKGNFIYESTAAGKSFVGRGLDAALVDNFMKNADLTDGTLNVVLKGMPDTFAGYLELNNILIKDTKLLNNILAFVNAVPALATFSSTGFDLDGYRINEGVMYLHYKDNILTIDELRTDGVAINTEAYGWIDNASRTLQLTMELTALKDYSWLLEKIPLAGYAILGENGSLSTSLDIAGSLDHPEIKTNLTREILMSPINIIKRTVEWPFRLFEKINGKDNESLESE